MNRIEELRSSINALVDELNDLRSSLTAYTERTGEPTAEEAEQFKTDLTSWESKNGELDQKREQLRQLEQIANAPERARETAPEPRAVGQVEVKAEPPVYNEGNQRDASFFADIANRNQDFEAQARLIRHARETGVQARDGSTANYAGQVIPQYLGDLVAPLLRAGRPFADMLRKAPLPPTGMTMNVSRITTGSTVGLQSAENAALSEQDIDDTLLAVSVRTLGGIQDVSRQAVERGIGVDNIIVQDLAAAYAGAVDAHVLTHATDGILNIAGTNAITYTDATPTASELYVKLMDAINQVNTNRYLPPNLIVMHPRRWAWFMAALDSGGRPFIVPTPVASNPLGTGDNLGTQTIVGTMGGLPVLVDPNVPTNLGAGVNEDRIIVTRTDDLILWEEPGAPLRVRVDEPGAHTLTIRYVLWGYLAFTGLRYAASTSIVAGTGLVPPTF